MTLHVSPVQIFVYAYLVFVVCFVSDWWIGNCEEVSNQDHFLGSLVLHLNPFLQKVPSFTPRFNNWNMYSLYADQLKATAKFTMVEQIWEPCL